LNGKLTSCDGDNGFREIITDAIVALTGGNSVPEKGIALA
jgi:hypothetical protein